MDRPLTQVVFGCDRLGARQRLPWRQRQQRTRQLAMLDSLWQEGFRSFDTAAHYGESEAVLGEWQAKRGIRDELTLITKGGHPGPAGGRLTEQDLRFDLDRSLERLRTDRIDLYLLHYDDPYVPVDEIIDLLHEHVRSGRIGALGVSNWHAERIAAANAYARSRERSPFVVASGHYSLTPWRVTPWQGAVSFAGPMAEAERTWLEDTRLPLLAWAALSMGFCRDRVAASREGQRARSDHWPLRLFGSTENLERLERGRQIARRRGVGLSQIALAYVLSQPKLVVFPVVGCYSPEHSRDVVEATEVVLTPQELAWLDLRE